jgi:hypothetical protein
MEPVGSSLYSQKPSYLAHSKESAQPEAQVAFRYDTQFVTPEAQLRTRGQPLIRRPYLLYGKCLHSQPKDSPRRIDAEHNQHGTYRRRHTNENFIHAGDIELPLLGNRQIISTLMHPYSASCRSPSTATVTGCAGLRRLSV